MNVSHENLETEIAGLIEELKSKNAQKRNQAGRVLQLIGAPAVEPLLDLLRQQRAPLAETHPRMLVITGIYLGLFIALVNGKVPFAWWVFFTFASLITIKLYLQTPRGTRIDAVGILAQMEDIRTVGPLAEALEYNDAIWPSHIDSVAAQALVRLLPRLKAGDGALLNERQRVCLARQLDPNGIHRKRRNLILAILKVFEQIGDKSAIPHVTRLAAGAGPYVKDREVREAAGSCLVFLKQHAQSNRAQQTLLRPASPSVDDKNTLLRPGIEHAEVNPHELLRTPIAADEETTARSAQTQ